MQEEKKLQVLMVKPLERARMMEISGSLESMQEIVGGYIQSYRPFDDDVAIICNDEGKLLGMMPNRAIYDDKHEVVDVIAGDFFVCYAPPTSEEFESLPKDLAKKYEKMFRHPEVFLNAPGGIAVIPLKPNREEQER